MNFKTTMIRLVMIVKNEQDVIERSLSSALPHVDSWCIVDTGSTDDTKAVIERVAKQFGVPGKLYDRPWINFGHNRTEALQLAREQEPQVEWLFSMDADDILHGPEGEKIRIPGDTDRNAFAIKFRKESIESWRAQVFSASLPWVYKGVVHEYADLEGDVPQRRGFLDFEDIWLDARTEGFRSKNPNKYQDDAKLLDEQVERDPSDTRSLFYAAQSWRDCGEYEKALQRYVKRAYTKAGYSEERYVSFLNAIRMTPNFTDAKQYAWDSLDVNPRRRETAVAFFKRVRMTHPSTWTNEFFALGLFVSVASSSVPLASFLFAEASAYRWAFSDEFSIVAYYRRQKAHAMEHSRIAYENAPLEQRDRIKINVEKSEQLPVSV